MITPEGGAARGAQAVPPPQVGLILARLFWVEFYLAEVAAAGVAGAAGIALLEATPVGMAAPLGVARSAEVVPLVGGHSEAEDRLAGDPLEEAGDHSEAESSRPSGLGVAACRRDVCTLDTPEDIYAHFQLLHGAFPLFSLSFPSAYQISFDRIKQR